MPYSMLEDQSEFTARLAGSIVVSNEPGRALRMWRERLQVRQVALAKRIGISPSVLSDYESGRRPSPGVPFVKRYVESLVQIDLEEKKLLTKVFEPSRTDAILAMGEFSSPVLASKIAGAVAGEVLAGRKLLSTKIYGYTVLDSVKTIYALSGFDFYRIFGATTERVLIFTKVGLGRSPLVAIRVSPLKPRMVVIHGPKTLDPLAIDLAERERIVLALSSLSDGGSFPEILRSPLS